MDDEQLQRVLAEGWLAEVESLDVAALRAKRSEAEVLETRVSYARRILQGRIDVLRAEVLRRTGGDDAGVFEHLADVLADRGARTFDPVTARPPSGIDTDEIADVEMIEGPAELSTLDEAELQALADRWVAEEARLSGLRRQLFGVIDRLQSEIAERYRTGAASVGELLAGD